jgi:hypothetical protein
VLHSTPRRVLGTTWNEKRLPTDHLVSNAHKQSP